MASLYSVPRLVARASAAVSSSDRAALAGAALPGSARGNAGLAESGYAAGLLAVGAATIVALALGLGTEPGVFAPFLVAIVATALRAGPGPALVAIAASIVVTYAWFLGPLLALAFDPAGLRRLALFRLGVFAASGLAIVLIAERHRGELDGLLRSRRQLKAFFADETVGLQVVDSHGVITWADQAAIELLGYDSAEHVGSHLSRFHADQTLARCLLASLAGGKTVENLRARLVRKDGTTVEMLVNSNALLSDPGATGTGVLLALLPIAAQPGSSDASKLAVSSLLERRRRPLGPTR